MGFAPSANTRPVPFNSRNAATTHATTLRTTVPHSLSPGTGASADYFTATRLLSIRRPSLPRSPCRRYRGPGEPELGQGRHRRDRGDGQLPGHDPSCRHRLSHAEVD